VVQQKVIPITTTIRVPQNTPLKPTTPRPENLNVDRTTKEQIAPKQAIKQAPQTEPKTNKQTTKTKIKQPEKDAITASNRAIFTTISKVVKQNRTTLYTRLLPHIASLKLPGLVRIQASAESFYIVMFETSDQRDNTIELLGRSEFVFNKERVPIIVHAFGDDISKPNVIWTVAAGPLATTSSVRDAIIQHLQTHFPDFGTSFTVRKKMAYGYCNGEWAVHFDKPPPKFIKQMKINLETTLITQEPLYTCRFCGLGGHNIFQCTNTGIRTLSNCEVTGTIGDLEVPPEHTDKDMEDDMDTDEQDHSDYNDSDGETRDDEDESDD
jgi:hypothetical protein